MRSAIARLFLAGAAASLRIAARLLQKGGKLKRLDPGSHETVDSLAGGVSQGVGEMLQVIRSVHGGGEGNRSLAGFTYSQSSAPAQRKIIVFDLVDGSQCYYIDPPGVCCCGSC